MGSALDLVQDTDQVMDLAVLEEDGEEAGEEDGEEEVKEDGVEGEEEVAGEEEEEVVGVEDGDGKISLWSMI